MPDLAEGPGEALSQASRKDRIMCCRALQVENPVADVPLNHRQIQYSNFCHLIEHEIVICPLLEDDFKRIVVDD